MTSNADSDAPGPAAAGAADFDAAPYEPVGAEVAELLVEPAGIESETDDPSGSDRMAERPEEPFSTFGPIARHPIGPGGAGHLVLSIDGAAPAPDELGYAAVFGHYDTVWPRGSIERLPARVDSGCIASGPGCFDMRGGLVQLYYALAELRARELEHVLTASMPRRAALIAGLPAEV